MLTDRWFALRPHNDQSRLWYTKARFVGVAAGRGSGKTECMKRYLVRRSMCKVSGCVRPMYFYSAPTLRQSKRIAWEDLKALMPASWLATSKPGRAAISDSDLVIRTQNNSEIHVVGMDKPQRVEGDQWCGCVCDEQSDQRPKAYALSIRPALSHYQGWCRRIGVPKRYGIGAPEFKGLFGPDSEWETYSWKSATVLSPEEILEARRNLDEQDFAEQYEANWLSAGGQAFHAFDENVNIRQCRYSPHEEIVVGSDFNVNPMAWVLCHVRQQRIEVFDELWLRDTNTLRTLNILWQRYGENHRGGWRFIGDATGAARKTSASESDYIQIRNDQRFKPKVVQYPHSNPPVKDRLASTNAMLKNALDEVRLHVDPSCKALKTDLSLRALNKFGEPDDRGDMGHITDALGYVVHKLFPINYIVSGSNRIGASQPAGRV